MRISVVVVRQVAMFSNYGNRTVHNRFVKVITRASMHTYAVQKVHMPPAGLQKVTGMSL